MAVLHRSKFQDKFAHEFEGIDAIFKVLDHIVLHVRNPSGSMMEKYKKNIQIVTFLL